MKQKVVFVVGILLVAVIAIGIIRAISMRSPKEGDLRVESQPTASVFLDNKHIGKTPLGKTPVKITAGEYTMKITADDNNPPLAAWEGKVTVRQNSLTYVNATLSESELTTASDVLWLEKTGGSKAELSVISNPDGASVLVDDEMKGFTPITISDLPAGQHTLTVATRGFINRTVKIKTTSGYRVMSSIKLALSPGGAQPTPEASPSSEAVATTPAATGKTTPAPTGKTTPVPTVKGTPSPTPKAKTPTADPAKPYVVVKDTPTGFLNVRKGPSTSDDQITQIMPGEKYSFLDEKDGWYQIQATATESGWISAKYADKVE
jgi:hypothetical protein